MRKLILGALAIGVSFGSASEAMAREKPVLVIRSIGTGPVNKCGTAENQWNGSVRALGLIASQEAELKQMIAEDRGEKTVVQNGEMLDGYLGCSKGRVVDVVPRGYQGIKLQVPYVVTSKTYRLSDGRVIEIIDKCGNWIIRAYRPFVQPKPEVEVTYTPTIETQAPPQMETPVMEPVMEEREVEVVEKSTAQMEWEAIAGVWVGKSGLAKFRGAYAEATAYVPLGDGWKLGGGIFGMWGAGESLVSPYSWDEHRYGPQVALRHDYMKCRDKSYGDIKQEECFPAGDGIKVRYLWDSVSGGNPVSGYNMKQKGHGIDIYAEHVERTSDKFMWGVTGEAFLYGGGRINSTWSGDKPQNRSFYQVNGFGQWRVNDHWQVRAGAGLTHQAWDKVNYLSLFAEARWDETIMCGPRLSLALNRPDSYKPFGRGKLDTLMAFCRIELGGKMRAWDQERRRKRVQLVQVGMRPVVRREVVGPENSAIYLPNLEQQGEAVLDIANPLIAKPVPSKTIINLNAEE